MNSIYCCGCGDEIAEEVSAALLDVDYQIPGEEPMSVHAVCCSKCATSYESEIGKQVIQMLISAKLARVRNPDKSWRKDE